MDAGTNPVTCKLAETIPPTGTFWFGVGVTKTILSVVDALGVTVTVACAVTLPPLFVAVRI